MDRLAPDQDVPRAHIVSELRGLQQEIKYPKNSENATYIRPTLRFRPKRGADNDDFAMVSAINPFQIELFKLNPAYTRARGRAR